MPFFFKEREFQVLIDYIQKKGAGTFCMNYACTLISGKHIAY